MTEHEYAAYIYHKMRNEGDDVDAYKRGILDAIEMLTKLIYPNIYNRIEKIEVFSIGLSARAANALAAAGKHTVEDILKIGTFNQLYRIPKLGKNHAKKLFVQYVAWASKTGLKKWR